MSEQTPDRGLRLPFLALAIAASTKRERGELQAVLAWGAIGAAVIAIVLYFFLFEGGLADTVFATAVTLAVGATIVCICRSVLVATVVVITLVGIIRTLSYAKQQASEVVLHAYDLVAFLSSWSAIIGGSFLHSGLALSITVAVLATTVAGCILARSNLARVPRPFAVGALALLTSVAWIADTARGPRRHTEFYFENAYVTFFYASWSETVQALWRGRLIEATTPKLVAPQQERLTVPATCTPATKLPHIILIHQESVVPPSFFPTLSYDRSLDSFFHSFDGKLNKLRVETYGGASWLTEFSVMTGLSAQSFGGMRQFLQHVMAGGIHDTLPQALGRCGYRNVMFYPMLRNFLGSGRFFEAVGLREIIDAKAQGAKLANERDRFYYANALAEIGRHVETSNQPLFLYIQTMAAHGPYDYAYSPEVDVTGGGPGTHPPMNEYLRRLAMTRMDYAFLRSALVHRFPGQAFLIVHYGDHQPTATQSLLGFDENASIEDILASGNNNARMTYYALDAVRYRPPPLPSLDVLDVAYLSTMLLQAAGVPLSDSYRERGRLMMLCKGRYHDCPAREEVLDFHRRLIDSGLMKAL